MKRKYKTVLPERTAEILRSKEGASIVLVTIISILVVASIIVLSINVNTLITSADRQYFRDQAYEAARTMGQAVDGLINEGKLPLEEYIAVDELIKDTSNNVNVVVKVEEVTSSSNTYSVVVTANSAGEEYVYTATYFGSGKTYMRVS